MRFTGTKDYVATDDLKVAVNAAITLRRPLLIKGEPGTGKTVLAQEIATAMGAPLIEWNVKSTTKAHQGLYEYDAVARLRDGQLGDERVHDIRNYIRKGKLWEAFTSPELPVLLIDEIDKADIEFPNDLLQELDRMSFDVYETHETIKAASSPRTTKRNCPTHSCAAVSSTTSNSPTARRCKRLSMSTSPASRKSLSAKQWTCSTKSAMCRG
jgi:MoxR-like ATPase